MSAISAAESSKSNTVRFSRIRSEELALGIVMLSSWSCQRRMICAAVRSCSAARARITGSRSTWPRPSGLHASVRMPRASCFFRSSPCCSQGCSSIWLTAGNHFGGLHQAVQMVGLEVGDADRPDLALLVQRFHGAVAFRKQPLPGAGPMDQVQVDVLQAKVGHGRVERPQRRVIAVIVIPDLGGDEEVLAGQGGGQLAGPAGGPREGRRGRRWPCRPRFRCRTWLPCQSAGSRPPGPSLRARRPPRAGPCTARIPAGRSARRCSGWSEGRVLIATTLPIASAAAPRTGRSGGAFVEGDPVRGALRLEEDGRDVPHDVGIGQDGQISLVKAAAGIDVAGLAGVDRSNTEDGDVHARFGAPGCALKRCEGVIPFCTFYA